ncbi:MAG: alpha-2-macroglobulin family protein [bacterium]
MKWHNKKKWTLIIIFSLIVSGSAGYAFQKNSKFHTQSVSENHTNSSFIKTIVGFAQQKKEALKTWIIQTDIQETKRPQKISSTEIPMAVIELYKKIKNKSYTNPKVFRVPSAEKLKNIPDAKLNAENISLLPSLKFPLGNGTKKITFASPVGQASTVTQIVIDYESDQVPVGVSDASHKVFSLKPEAEGTLFFSNPKRLIYQLDHALPFGTRYTVTIDEVSFRFDTARPKVQKLNLDGSGRVPRSGELFIEFNQPMNLESLEKYMYLKLEKTRKKIPVIISKFDTERNYSDWHIKQMSPTNSYIIKSSVDLPYNSKFTLNILAGAKSALGNLGLEEDLVSEKIFVSPTPMFLQVMLPWGDKVLHPNSKLLLAFSTQVEEESLLRSMRVYPPEEIKIKAKRTQTFGHKVYVDISGFQPRKNYVLYFVSPIQAKDGTTFIPEPYPIYFSDYKPSIQVPQGNILQEKIGTPSISLLYRNYDVISLKARPLQNASDIADYLKYRSDSTYNFHKTIKTKSTPNVLAYQHIPISTIVPSLQYPIAFQIQATGQTSYYRSLMQFSNIGITAKIGYFDGLIWVNKLTEGVSYPDVKISIYEYKKGRAVLKFSGKSDKDGLLAIPSQKSLGQTDQLLIIAEKDADFAFALDHWNGGISQEDFNLYLQTKKAAGQELSYYYYNSQSPELYFDRYQKGTRALTFVERKLYSPGEKVQFKAVLRHLGNRNLSQFPQNKEIKVSIFDPMNQKIETITLTMDDFSSISGGFLIPEDALLGKYSIRYLDQSASFQVQEFKTQNFDVKLTAPKKNDTAGNTIVFNGFATYLQGGVMKNTNVETWIKQSSTSFQPPGYQQYTFSYSPKDEGLEPYYQGTQTLLYKNIKTNKKGQFNITVPTEKKQQASKIIADVTVQDLQGDVISKSHAMTLHPAEFYLGIKKDSPLVQAGKKMSLNLVAVRPNGEQMDMVSVKTKVYFKGSEVLRYKSLGNTFLTKQTPKSQLLETQTFTLSKTDSKFEFTPQHAGNYTLVFESTDSKGNLTKSSRSFDAYGLGDPQWQLYDHDRIDLESDKEIYNVGDMATILIKSPVSKGTALVTVEREGVLDHFMVDFTSASPIVRIPIKELYFPNAYISVTLIQGRVSKPPLSGVDLGKPTFRVGYLHLKVKSPDHDLTIDLKTDKKNYQPREKVTLDINISEISKKTGIADVAVAVVDEALLNLMPNKIDPIASFFKDHPLRVRTAQNRIHFKGRRTYGQKGVGLGGGGGELLSADTRHLFLNSVYWNPSIRTNEQGKASVSFTVPDNLTTFRIIAFGQTKGSRFGVTEKTFKVSKELSVFSVFPKFLVQGDSFEAGVNIHNQSELKGIADITAFSNNLSINSKSDQMVTVSKKSVTPAMFSFSANKRGLSNYGFKAQLGNLEDSIEQSIVVHDALSYLTTATYGRLKPGSLSETIMIPEIATANRGHIKVSLSASKLSSIEGAVKYLNGYTHDSLEQQYAKTIGRIGNTALMGKRLKSLSVEDSKFIRRVIRDTNKYFNSDKGLGFWPQSRYSSPYLSSFIAQVLLMYEEIGVKVPNYYFSRLDKYFKKMLDDPLSFSTHRLHAFNYLAKRGKIGSAMVERFMGQRSEFTLTERLLLAEGLYYVREKAELAQSVFKECKPFLSFESGEVFFDEKTSPRFTYMIHPRLYLNILGLSTMLTLTPNDPLVYQLAQYLSTTQLQKGFWSNTQENAQIIMAMVKFREIKELSDSSFETQVQLKNNILGSYTAKQITTPPQAFISPIKQIVDESIPLKLNTTGEGSGYYRVELRYAIPAAKATRKNHGFQVNRSYFNANNTLVAPDSFKAGERYRVAVSIRINERKDFIAVQDFLPAGFEMINPALGGADTLIRNTFSTYFKNPDPSDWIDHTELRHEQAIVYATNLKNGSYTLNYFVRATHPGTYTARAPHAEEMYSPEVFGNGSTQTIIVNP